MAIICVNSLALFLRAFPSIEQDYHVLFYVDYVCSIIFVVEMAIKIHLYSWRGYWRNGWNQFDGSIVVLSLPALLSPWLPQNDYTWLLVLRAGRILRFFRLLRIIPDTERMIRGIARALRASIGVLLALALYGFILGLCAHYLFQAYSPEHFGDPLVSIYSIIKVFTIEGWFEIPDALAAEGQTTSVVWMARCFFTFAVFTGGVIGLSMANAIFVDEMVLDNNDDVKDQLAAIGSSLERAGGMRSQELIEIRTLIENVQERLARIEAREGEPPGPDDPSIERG